MLNALLGTGSLFRFEARSRRSWSGHGYVGNYVHNFWTHGISVRNPFSLYDENHPGRGDPRHTMVKPFDYQSLTGKSGVVKREYRSPSSESERTQEESKRNVDS